MGTSGWTQDQWLQAAAVCGLSPSNFVPPSLQSTAAAIASRHVPTGAPSNWQTVATASLIARGIIYFKNSPGDCGSPTAVSFSEGQQVASGIAGFAAAAAPLPGIGQVVSLLNSIFAAHAQAVANEQLTICKVASIINQVFAYYDAQVRNGRISPNDAYAGMQAFLAQTNGQLATIEKQCNAACVYSAILAAHAEYVQTYYPQIAPYQAVAHSPGAPPVVIGTAPGGVIQVGGQGGSIPVSVVGGVSAYTVPADTLLTIDGYNVSTIDAILGIGVILLVLILLFR